MQVRSFAIMGTALVICCVGGYATFLLVMSWPISDLTVAKSGVFGDSFGVLSSLFSGLAFVGLISATLLQREQLESQRNELTLQRQELKLQREAMELTRLELARSAEALEANKTAAQLQTKFHALSTMLQIHQIRQNIVENDRTGKLFTIARQIEKQVEQFTNGEA